MLISESDRLVVFTAGMSLLLINWQHKNLHGIVAILLPIAAGLLLTL